MSLERSEVNYQINRAKELGFKTLGIGKRYSDDDLERFYENSEIISKLEPNYNNELLNQLQKIRDEISQGSRTVDEFDDWIAEPLQHFQDKYGYKIPRSDEEDNEYEQACRASENRKRIAHRRLIRYDVLPLEVLPLEARNMYRQRSIEGLPQHPYILDVNAPTEESKTFDEDLAAGNLKLYAFREEEASGTMYLEVCSKSEFFEQVNEAAIYDNEQRSKNMQELTNWLNNIQKD